MKSKKTIAFVAAGVSLMLVALVVLLLMLAVLIGLNRDLVDDLWVSLLLALGEKPSLEIASSSCRLLDLPGEGPRAFEVKVTGNATGSPGDAVLFFGPPARAEHSCTGWTDCSRPEDGPVFTHWDVTGTEISEEELLPDYVAYFTVRIENDGGALTETELAIPCATTYKLSVSVMSTVAGFGGGSVSADPPILGCDTSCEATVLAGEWVTLYATPHKDSGFDKWADDCYGTPSTEPCRLRIETDRRVRAWFGPLVGRHPELDDLLNPASGDPTAGGDGSAGGTVSFVAQCSYIGRYGINLSEYEVFLSGSAGAPAGGFLSLLSDPPNTVDAMMDCGAWGSTCTSDGSPTDWTYRYGFYSQGTPRILYPSGDVTDARFGILNSATAELHCP